MATTPIRNTWEEQALAEAERRAGRLVEHLARLVQIPSVSGDEGSVAAEVARWAAEENLPAREIVSDIDVLSRHPAFTPAAAADFEGRPNVVVTLPGSGDGKSLALFSHTDVVPVDPMTTWTHGPWSGEVVEGKLFGRGAADCKGGAAVSMVALEILRDLGAPLRGDVQAQFVIEEEQGGNGTLGVIEAGVRADAMIQLEPTSTRYVLISNRGAQFFRIRVPGEEGGVEYQHALSSAIDNAADLLTAIRQYSLMREAALSHPLYTGRYPTLAPLAVCRFAAGEWPSTVPGEAVLEGTIECLPGEDIDEVVAAFEQYVARAAAQHPWLKDHLPTFERFGLRFEAAEIAPDDALVTTLQSASESVLGYAPEVVGGGGSDLRLPVIYASCPTVLYGPGGGMIHSVDEHVLVDQLVESLKVVLVAALRWTS
jgi:acetylornithine deacetylase